MIQDGVNIHRRRLKRPLVAEHLHAVNEGADTARLVDDQAREHAVVFVQARLQQLRCTTDTGEWVLDLMGEHARHARNRASGLPL